MAKLELTGQKLGRWTVLEPNGRNAASQLVWKCRCQCGTVRDVVGTYLTRGRSRSCGCLMRERLAERNRTNTGAKHIAWKGGKGRYICDGYVRVYDYDRSRNRTTGEHVLVVERRLGRALLPGETVHHKNGVRSDNSDDNLELWSTSHPRGQRIEDKTAWAIEWLQIYKPECLKDQNVTP